MPPLDSWLSITFRAPYLLVIFIVLLFFGLASGCAYFYLRKYRRIKDLHDRIQNLETQLANHSEKERVWNSAKDSYQQFLHTISHEVSNPLQSIQTNLDNMAKCTPGETGRWHQYNNIIIMEIRRLAKLTENLRLLSRLETPGAAVNLEPINMRTVIESVIMALAETAEENQVKLKYSGPDRPARILGNRDQFQQVVTNLVDNAIKYRREVGGEVIISVQEDQDRLCVRVSDEGIGIPEEDLPHIFETAYRVSNVRSSRRKGSGLGLSVVKRIVEQYGGEIRVHSQLGEGTTFSFDLPIYNPS